MAKQRYDIVSMNLEQFQQINDLLDQISTQVDPVSVTLTPVERQRLRNVGQRRRGYVAEVLRAAKQFENNLPRRIDVETFERQIDLHDFLTTQIEMIQKITQRLEDTTIALGDHIMSDTDQVYNVFQTLRKKDTALNALMQQIEIHHKRPRSDDDSIPDPGPDNIPDEESSISDTDNRKIDDMDAAA